MKLSAVVVATVERMISNVQATTNSMRVNPFEAFIHFHLKCAPPRSASILNTYLNGNPVTTYVLVQIIDIDSLLRAYLLTDDGTPTGNIVATIEVGPVLDVTNSIRPTLPTIDWKAGTVQEIQY
jgi:hypothetical protein